MKVGDVICVANFHDLCRGDTFATLSGTCPGLCRKVGVMEFGLYNTGDACLILLVCGIYQRWK